MAVQVLIVLCALLALPFLPPASGRVLLIPMTASASAELPRFALNSGASLVGAGPFHGSMVVIAGERTLMRNALSHHILVIAAGIGGCGQERSL